MSARFAGPILLVVALGAFVYVGNQQHLFSFLVPPCSEPVEYHIGTFDTRFDISEAAFKDALADAAAVWNKAAGKTLVAYAEDGDLPVSLVYGEEQRTSELGEEIDEEQVAYDRAKASVEALNKQLEAAKRSYSAMTATFEREADEYEADVAYWNARGGAPPAEYAKLQAKQRKLAADQEDLNTEAAVVNSIIDQMNAKVAALNELGEKINRRVDVYNARAHTDFDQGRYIKDENGARITIREFTEGIELRRVLAHEFGHALGLDHVENTESIMYSYNIGSSLELTAEDLAELKQICHLE